MAVLPLDDLAARISQQEAQLQGLRRELESRQRQLADLAEKKERLLSQLQQIDAQIAGIAGRPQPVKSSRAKKAKTKPGRVVVIGNQARNGVPAGRPTLRELIVTMIREAGRPLTVKEMAQEAKRRRFKSSSHDFPRMLAVRARELKHAGILKAAVGQPGFALARSNGRLTTQRGPAARANSTAGKSKHVPLREVLTRILEKSTRPMTGSELAAEALRAGYRSTSKNFVDVVWVAMGNLKNVEHVPDQGYRLKRAKA
jgi:hypothetical protein